jgi:hypothetical protein
MSRRYESLTTKAARKLSPKTLSQISSPVLFKTKNELAKHIQEVYRKNMKFGPTRKASKMTTSVMRKQLSKFWSNPINSPSFNIFFNTTFRKIFDDLDWLGLTEPEKIEILINNLSRPILELFYNSTWMLDIDEEDVKDITNPIYFKQVGGRKKHRKTIKYRKTKK